METTFDLSQYFSPQGYPVLIRVTALVLIGVPIIFSISRWIRNWMSQRFNAQRGMVFGKAIKYVGNLIILVLVLRELGFQLGPLLGAAGIVGIAVGFASQTSISNIISGVFLIVEQPFVVGDVIVVGGTTGEVLSVDVLSVKLRTFDNRFVRIPNETLLKSEMTTLTRFPIRRIDLVVGVAYKEDLAKVQEILMDIAEQENRCLQEPRPLIIFEGFGDSSINIKFAVWAARGEWLAVKNSMFLAIKNRFDQEGIEIPFPHRTIYAGSVTEPLPVTISPMSPEKHD